MTAKTAKPKKSKSTLGIEGLEDRRLFAASLNIVQPLLVFNAVKNSSASQTEILTLTNTGDAPLNFTTTALNLVADSGASPADTSRFTIVNKASLPASLAAGQSFDLQLTYKATAVGVNSAYLQVTSDAPIQGQQYARLRGIGTAGLGGTNQPSLARILRAYNIPTIVGTGPNDSNEANALYPEPADPSSQEVVMQQMAKAGSGPVTIQVLASFTAAGTHPYTLGLYTPGNPTDRHELFYTSSSEYQSTYVHPQGSTSFDPGNSAFGFYFLSNVQVKGRVGYTEDALNTWDTTDPRKVRMFPMENVDGSVVPNTYILTTTEWNAPVGYDFTNIVAVVSNIKPAPSAPAAPVMGLQIMNPLPGSDRMIFNTIHDQNKTLGDIMHNTGTLQVNNTGASNLVISSYSTTGPFTLIDPATGTTPAFPISIAAHAFKQFTVKFTATTAPTFTHNQTNDTIHPTEGGTWTGSLTLNGNDPNNPSKTVPLAGYWQRASENDNEPNLQTLVNLMAGYTTNINPTFIPGLLEDTNTTGSKPTYYGEETVSAYWTMADSTQPVSVMQLAAYHTQGNSATFGWYVQGTKSPKTIITTASDSNQSVFPTASGTSTGATASFTPSTATTSFGFVVDNKEWSDDSFNTAVMTGGGHHMRFYPVRDATGALVPNTYIVGEDYGNVPENFDFQDNAYIVSNIRPTGSPPAPSDMYASTTGTSTLVSWAPVQYTNTQGYNIYRSTSSNSGFTLLSTSLVTTNFYVDNSAPAGVTEYYRVTAVDSATGFESAATEASAIGSAATSVPPTPTGLTATGVQGGVQLQWNPVADSTLKGYNIYFSATANGQYQLLTSPPTTSTLFVDVSAPVGVTRYYHVTAVDSVSGLESGSAAANGIALAAQPTGTVTSADIGATPAGSTNVITNGVNYDVVAGGPGITANADGFRYIYQQQSGSFDVKVQVSSLTVAGNFSTAGIMARSTLDPASANVYMSASPVNYRFKYRTASGATTTVITGANVNYPNTWVRLTRVSNVFTGYSSTDGVNWTQVSSVTLNLPNPLYLGLAVASNNATQTTTAQLRNYSQTFGVGSISGKLYSDVNGDRTFNAGDSGLAGQTVYLDLNNNNIYDASSDITAITASDGSYTFANVQPGQYHVQDVLPDSTWWQTQPASAGGYIQSIAAGQNATGLNFGTQQLGIIIGNIYNDANGYGVRTLASPPLSGWTVFVDGNGNGSYDPGIDAVTISDPNGNYSLNNVLPNTWKVYVIPQPGYKQLEPTSAGRTVKLTAGQVNAINNFGFQANGVIIGKIFLDVNENGGQDYKEPGLGNWTVYLDNNNNGVFDAGIDRSVGSDGNGWYSFDHLAPGTYTLMMDPVSNFIVTTPAFPVTLTVQPDIYTIYSIGVNAGTITGSVFDDQNGTGTYVSSDPGLAGWTVYLDFNNNHTFDQGTDLAITTDPDGDYGFIGLAPGTYHVNEVLPAGWTLTTPTSSGYTFTLGVGGLALDQKFGNYPPAPSPTFTTGAKMTAFSTSLISDPSENDNLLKLKKKVAVFS